MQKEQSNSNIGLLFFVSFLLNGKFSNTISPALAFHSASHTKVCTPMRIV